MKRPISERQAQASLHGGDRGWEDGEQRAGSVKLPVPPGRSRTLSRHGEGRLCLCGLRKPPEAPWDSSMLAHLGKGFLQNCKRGARRLKPLRAETNNHNHDNTRQTQTSTVRSTFHLVTQFIFLLMLILLPLYPRGNRRPLKVEPW